MVFVTPFIENYLNSQKNATITKAFSSYFHKKREASYLRNEEFFFILL